MTNFEKSNFYRPVLRPRGPKRVALCRAAAPEHYLGFFLRAVENLLVLPRRTDPPIRWSSAGTRWRNHQHTRRRDDEKRQKLFHTRTVCSWQHLAHREAGAAVK